MSDLLTILKEKNIILPDNIKDVLNGCSSYTVFNTTEELSDAATNGKENTEFEVAYDVPGKGNYVEAVVQRVKNGISANYTEAYMRRRDPGTMVIADNQPTDKKRFVDKYGYEFSGLQTETFNWLKDQDLAVFFYFAGRENIGSLGIAIAPANAAFLPWACRCYKRWLP